MADITVNVTDFTGNGFIYSAFTFSTSGGDAYVPPTGGSGGGGSGGGGSSSGSSSSGMDTWSDSDGLSGTVVVADPHYTAPDGTEGSESGSSATSAYTAYPNLGWNSGAHSEESLPADWTGLIDFYIPDVGGLPSTGAAVGLTTQALTDRNGYDHLRYGFVFTSEAIKFIADGEVVKTYDRADAIAARDPETPDRDYARLEIFGSFVVLFVPGLPPEIAPFSMAGDFYLDGTLYAAGDSVDSPRFIPAEEAELTDSLLIGMSPLGMDAGAFEEGLVAAFQPMVARMSEVWLADITASFKPMSMTGGQPGGVTGISGMEAAFKPMVARMSEHWMADVSASFKPMSMTATGGEPDPTIKFTYLTVGFPRLSVKAEMPNPWELMAAFRPMGMRASAEPVYAEIEASFKPMGFKAYAGENGPYVHVPEILLCYAPATPTFYVGIVVHERMGASATVEVFTTVTADATEKIGLEEQLSLMVTAFEAAGEQIGAGERVAVTLLRTGADGPVVIDLGEAWAVNMDTDATTRYDAYGFNSFAKLGDQHFGVRPDGVYLLEGDDDAGAPIVSGVALGKHDFGTQALKHIPAVHVGVSSAGRLFLKVGDGRSFYTYRARSAGESMQVQRFDLGRGLRTNYYTFDLTSEADAFELDTVTFQVLASQRKI